MPHALIAAESSPLSPFTKLAPAQLCSPRLIRSPQIEIPSQGPREYKIPVQYIPHYAVNIRFDREGTSFRPPENFIQGMELHLIDSTGPKSSSTSRAVKAQTVFRFRTSDYYAIRNYTATVKQAGTYELRSADKRIPPQTIQVIEGKDNHMAWVRLSEEVCLDFDRMGHAK